MDRKNEPPNVVTHKHVKAEYDSAIGFPGEFPFTRGIQPTMYRGRLWTMRQYAGYGTAEEANARFRYLITHGQTGLSVAFDLPTQVGLDSDHALARGEVGRVGVAIDTVSDMERLFSGIDLSAVSTSMTTNSQASVILGMYATVARSRGTDLKGLRGTVMNDVLKEYVARGTYIFPPRPSMRLTVDLIEWCAKEMPRWYTISVSGYHMREAGCNAVQELAFTFADAIAYVEAVKERGLGIETFAGRMAFFFAAHNDVLEEVAKFRAARRIWARIMKDRYGVTKDEAMKVRFHAQTAGSTLTACQLENNVVRVTLQALAAVLGGAQSVHSNSMDEALGLPTEETVRLALRTQQIIAHESGVTNTIDPLGGSYYIEWLTDEMERRAMEVLGRIEAMGGAIVAIEKGYMQTETAKGAYEAQKAIDRGDTPVIGLNVFSDTVEGMGSKRSDMKEDPIDIEQAQVSALVEYRKRRDPVPVERSLDRLRKKAEGDENLMDPILDCIKAGSTLGEICQALKDIFGEHRTKGFD